MRGAGWTAAASVIAALTLPAAAEAASSWRVSGSLSGTYENAVTWDNCPNTGAIASFAEKVTVDTPMRDVRPLTTSAPGVVMKVTPGGMWSLNGSYPPRHESPRGGEFTCSAPVSVSCGGGVVAGGGAPAALAFFPTGRMYHVTFTGFPGVTESARVNPPADQPLCGGGGGSEDSLAVPMLGLDTSGVAAHAYQQIPSFPRSRLRRSRPFKLTSTGTPDPCDDAYLSCTQSGRVTLTLSFKPAR